MFGYPAETAGGQREEPRWRSGSECESDGRINNQFTQGENEPLLIEMYNQEYTQMHRFINRFALLMAKDALCHSLWLSLSVSLPLSLFLPQPPRKSKDAVMSQIIDSAMQCDNTPKPAQRRQKNTHTKTVMLEIQALFWSKSKNIVVGRTLWAGNKMFSTNTSSSLVMSN